MGRPKRSSLNSLKTKLWFMYIYKDLGVARVSQMDDALNARIDRHTKGHVSMHWYKYEKGLRTPNVGNLAAVERRIPGSRMIFDVGPNGAMLWDALNAHHVDLWKVIDKTFPEYKPLRNSGIFGLLQYKSLLNKLLIPEHYLKYTDYIAYSRGLQGNSVNLAFESEEISIAPSTIASVIAYWRLSSLVLLDLINADYLLSGVMSVLNPENSPKKRFIFDPTIDLLVWQYMSDYLKEEYPVEILDEDFSIPALSNNINFDFIKLED